MALFYCTLVSAEPSAVLVGPKWILITIQDKNLNLAEYGKQKPFISLQTDERYSAYAGCNQISGNYDLSGLNGLRFLPNALMTKMACMQKGNIEDQFLQLLNQVKYWNITDHNLIFSDESNNTLAVFRLI